MVTNEPEHRSLTLADYWLSATDQIIVTKNRALLDAPSLRGTAHILPRDPNFRLWTDDFYNLLGVLKWR